VDAALGQFTNFGTKCSTCSSRAWRVTYTQEHQARERGRRSGSVAEAEIVSVLPAQVGRRPEEAVEPSMALVPSETQVHTESGHSPHTYYYRN